MAPAVTVWPTTLDKLDCNLRYYWGSMKRYRPVQVHPALILGIAIHTALEEHYANGEDPVEVFNDCMDEEARKVSKVGIVVVQDPKMRKLGTAMLENYLVEYKDEEIEVMATEVEIARKVPIPSDDPDPPENAHHFYVASRVDMIVWSPATRAIWALDHKTYERFVMGNLEMSSQFIIEKFVTEGWVKAEGWIEPVAGTIYNGLWKRVAPTKSQSKLFQRHSVYINAHQVEVTMYRIYWQLRAMHSPTFKVYPATSTMKCQRCPFKQPCAEYIRGGDYQFVLDTLFVQADPYEHDLTMDDGSSPAHILKPDDVTLR